MQSDLDDFGDFYMPVLRALWERIGAGRWCDATRGDVIVGEEGR